MSGSWYQRRIRRALLLLIMTVAAWAVGSLAPPPQASAVGPARCLQTYQ
ncbi:MAG: hypothetical protein AB1758_07815 [Candidatus Eremiobacterota bacterium]